MAFVVNRPTGSSFRITRKTLLVTCPIPMTALGTSLFGIARGFEPVQCPTGGAPSPSDGEGEGAVGQAILSAQLVPVTVCVGGPLKTTGPTSLVPAAPGWRQ